MESMRRSTGSNGRQISQNALLAFSPSVGRDDLIHPDPERFVGEPVVATEKLDGGNTMLHRGAAYARSTSAPPMASGWPWRRSTMRGR